MSSRRSVSSEITVRVHAVWHAHYIYIQTERRVIGGGRLLTLYHGRVRTHTHIYCKRGIRTANFGAAYERLPAPPPVEGLGFCACFRNIPSGPETGIFFPRCRFPPSVRLPPRPPSPPSIFGRAGKGEKGASEKNPPPNPSVLRTINPREFYIYTSTYIIHRHNTLFLTFDTRDRGRRPPPPERFDDDQNRNSSTIVDYKMFVRPG